MFNISIENGIDVKRLDAPSILIASVQVPFTSGGAELLTTGLHRELERRGCVVDTVQLPFSALPKENIVKQMSMWRTLDLTSFNGRNVDAVICTKFPSYMVSHPNKIVWLIHQYRQAYDLYGTRFGDLTTSIEDEALRRMILRADNVALSECKAVYAISDNVTDRLKRYFGISGQTLVPPLPLGEAYYSGEPSNYILSVGRICSIKRVDLMIKAMAQVDDSLTLKVVGQADESEIEEYINSEIEKHHLWHRIEFLGKVDVEQLLALYAHAFVVYYAPFDEDLGFVTLEALRSGCPVITGSDSGGPLAYITHESNGLIVESNEEAFAQAVNRLLNDQELYNKLRNNAAQSVTTPSWEHVVDTLLTSMDNN